MRLDRFATGAADRREGRRRPAQSALRATCGLPVPIAARADIDEFTYLGDATVGGPIRRRRTRAGASTITSICATIRRGLHRELWYHGGGCHAWLVVTRDTRTHEITVDRCTSLAARERGETPRSAAAARSRLARRRTDRSHRGRCAFASTGKLSRALPAIRLPRRCSRTASRLVGRSFKYHRPRGILTAGSEEPNALVELRTGRAARAEHARDHRRALRRARRREPEPLAVARASTSWRSTSWLSPLSRRGLLLQDLHVAAAVLGDVVRAAIRRAAGLGRAAPDAGSRPLRKSIRALRRAGDRRGSGRPDGGARGGARRRARHPRATKISGSAGGCWRSGTRSTASRRRMGRGDRGRARVACPTCGSCAAPACPACSITGNTARSSGSTIICACRRAHQPRQRFWKIVAKRAVLAAGAHRAADRVRQQRPARRDAGGRGAHLPQPLCRRAGVDASRCSPTMTTAGAPRPTPRMRGVESRGGRSTRAPTRQQRSCRARHPDGARITGAQVAAVQGGAGAPRRSTSSMRTGRDEQIACDALAVSRWLESRRCT